MTSIDNELTRTFPAPESLAASIELGSGLVNVTAADVTEAVVTLAPSSPGDRDALDLIVRSRVDLHGSTLRIDVPRVTGFRPHPDVVVEATVPTGSSVSVKTGSADVRLTGTYSDVSVKTGSGDVWVDAGSTVQIGTGSGEVQLGLVDSASVKPRSTDGVGAGHVIRVAARERWRAWWFAGPRCPGVPLWSSGRAAVAAGWSGCEDWRRVVDPVEQCGPGGLPGPGVWEVQGDPAG